MDKDATDSRPVALVTGGTSGIGTAILHALAADYRLVFTWRADAATAEALARALPGTRAIQAELDDRAVPARLVAEVLETAGRLDLLVNAAGLVAEEDPQAFDMALAERLMRVNALVPAALASAAAGRMEPGGAIVNITSINATFPPVAAPGYAASKAALESYTRAQAKAFGPRGIRVNAVAPGAVERPGAPRSPALVAAVEAETALGSLATAQDVAQAVGYLARAPGVTGVILPVTRGFRM